ncbi:MAG: biotin/lipoyl-containing protein, partial [Flavobacteriales bacterium]
MATVINMPRLSDTMEEGVVAKWLKNVGDKIEEGDILAEIETDKATMEFESFYEGTLLHIGIPEGGSSPVDVLLAIIGEEGEDISEIINGSNADTTAEVLEETKEESTANSDSSNNSITVPEGVEVIKMPRLSDTMTDGTVAAWLKKVGDVVGEGDILAEIETDKATMEFECFYEGTILYIGVQEGETAPVDSLLTIIGPAGTDVSAIVANGGASTDSAAPENKPTETKTEKQEDKTKVKEATTSIPTANNSSGRIFASPLAKKIAADKGLNIANITGSGENGRITKKDVENYTPVAAPVEEVASSAPVATAPVMTFVASGEEKSEEIKNSQMRKAIAKSLGSSKFSAPDFSLNIEVDMDSAMASRKTINAIPDTKVSFNDMVVKACAMA